MTRNREKGIPATDPRLRREYRPLKTAGALVVGGLAFAAICGLTPYLQKIYDSLPTQPPSPIQPISPLVVDIDTTSMQATLVAIPTDIAKKVQTIVAAATQTAAARPTNTPTLTPTGTPVPTDTLLPTSTSTPSPTENYSDDIATAVQEAAEAVATTLAAQSTSTETVNLPLVISPAKSTTTPTNTTIPPTFIPTLESPTVTPLPPTATFTLTPQPTETPTVIPFPTLTPDICVFMAPAEQVAAGCPVDIIPTESPPDGIAPSR